MLKPIVPMNASLLAIEAIWSGGGLRAKSPRICNSSCIFFLAFISSSNLKAVVSSVSFCCIFDIFALCNIRAVCLPISKPLVLSTSYASISAPNTPWRFLNPFAKLDSGNTSINKFNILFCVFSSTLAFPNISNTSPTKEVGGTFPKLFLVIFSYAIILFLLSKSGLTSNSAILICLALKLSKASTTSSVVLLPAASVTGISYLIQ